MRVIGVIDVMNGVAVRAVGGIRERYRPVRCKLCEGCDPIEIAEGYRRVYGIEEIYVADLDAIMEHGSSLGVIRKLTDTGFRVMADTGASSAEEALRVVEAGARVVVGTETLRSTSSLWDVGEAVGWSNVALSLDFRGGRLLSRGELRGLSYREAAEAFYDTPVYEVIVLELSRVGTLRGPALDLVKAASSILKRETLAGGGVRDFSDLIALREAGASGVLVATALQDMLIRPEDVRRAMEL